jgi:tetratricopeptide (TPR) repeat protein
MTTQPSGFERLMQQALAASQVNDTEGALRLFTQASAEQPSSGLPHFLMGAELAQAGRIAEAEAAFANAVLLAPDLAIARYQLGLLQFTSGRAALALVTWQPLFTLPNSEPLQRFVHGFAALAQDSFQEALALFREGMAANTSNAPLNKDIQLVIDEVEKLLAKSGTAPAAEPEASQGESSHVLLSNYRQQGSLH